MPIHRVMSYDGKWVWDALECRVCGHIWIPENRVSERLPQACASRVCHTRTWNGKGITGRPAKPKHLPWATAKGHHDLCPCILCLTAISLTAKPAPNRPRGIAGTLSPEGIEAVRANMAKARIALQGLRAEGRAASEASGVFPSR